jgi:hypothetical protein
MRARVMWLATLAPLVLVLVSLALGVTALADPCPSPGSTGCWDSCAACGSSQGKRPGRPGFRRARPSAS